MPYSSADGYADGFVSGPVTGNGSTPPKRAGHTMRLPGSLKAPLLLAPIAAIAGFLHAHDPDGLAKTASRTLDAAVFLIGGGLLISDLLDLRHQRPFRPGAPLFAAAGLVGLLLEHTDREHPPRLGTISRSIRSAAQRIPRPRTTYRIVVQA